MSGGARCGEGRGPGFHAEAKRIPQFVVQALSRLGVFLQEGACIVAALSDSLTLITKPGARFFHYVFSHSQIDEIAFARYPFAVENIEFSLAEWRRYLVLHNFGA